MIKALFITFLLFAFYGNNWRCHAQELQYPGGQVQIAAYPVGCIGCQPVQVMPMMPAAPQIIYQPRTVYHPYQYQGSAIVERRYATPFRNALFGRWRGYHYYAPIQNQPQVQQ